MCFPERRCRGVVEVLTDHSRVNRLRRGLQRSGMVILKSVIEPAEIISRPYDILNMMPEVFYRFLTAQAVMKKSEK
ncbi:MAG: hypothetical protein A2Z83_09415 [Omnitrophica bacterium GWA2_52_8]|nr:MAG: hypothetical protein A2Z83_09415 [Omnitrophica bacterium GWA2_52_8]